MTNQKVDIVLLKSYTLSSFNVYLNQEEDREKYLHL